MTRLKLASYLASYVLYEKSDRLHAQLTEKQFRDELAVVIAEGIKEFEQFNKVQVKITKVEK